MWSKSQRNPSSYGLKKYLFENDVVIILVGDLLKSYSQKFHLGEIKFPSYHDKTIYPMEILKCYIDLTKGIRGDLTGLFIITTKPYSKASKDTLSRWVKGMLKGAGINMKIFPPYSTRSASTSMAKSVHLAIDLILKAEGWRSMKPHTKHYDKPIEKKTNLQKQYYSPETLKL